MVALAIDDLDIGLKGVVQTKTVVLDKPTLSCAYGDCGCFAAGLPGLLKSVASRLSICRDISRIL